MSVVDFLEKHFVSLYVLAILFCLCLSDSGSLVKFVAPEKGSPK